MRRRAVPRVLRVGLVLAFVLASLASLISVPITRAATFTIPDGDVAALIAAIDTANGNDQVDTIELAAGGTYILTAGEDVGYGPSGLPLIASEMTINGNGATIMRSTVDGTPDFRILTVIGGGNLTLDRVTIMNGRTGVGGGMYVGEFGTEMTLTNSTVTGNYAIYDGGGIYANFFTIVTISNSTIHGNVANYGGGIAYRNQATMINSTISDNTAGAEGGGIFSSSKLATLMNTIVAGNTAASAGNDISLAVTGTHNLIGDGAGMSGLTNGTNGNLVGTTADPIDPLLGPLANNGGPTQTMALLDGSPAINAGTSTDQTPLTDQRGTIRPQGSANDIGAYEFTVNHAQLCTMTQQSVRHPFLGRMSCASLMLAQRAGQANNLMVEQIALNMYRIQIRLWMAVRAISATDGQELLDWSNTLD